MTMCARVMMIAMAAAMAIAIAGCGGGGGSKGAGDATAGPARGFMMGFSTLPRELNAKAYADTFDLAAANGDIVLIQRTPPWADFLPGANVSEQTAKTTASEKDAIASKKLKLFFAIDPTDGSTGRDRLAGLPDALAGRNFGDASVRSAFVSYARYVALNYRPAYMALVVEVNLYYEKNKGELDNVKSLYDEAYDRVKEISPATQVTLTFQYEDLQGKLPAEEPHFADWPLLRQFEDRMDVMAISTYPSFWAKAASDIPDTYFSQLRAFTDKPIVIAEMGYASAPGAAGINNGTEQEQAAFVQRALDEAQKLRMPLVIWFAGWDPSYATDTAAAVFAHIGLLRADGSEKPAWAAWAAAARRPYVAPGGGG